MLLEFRVKNYRSFADEQTLSLVASNDDSHEDKNIHHVLDYRTLKSTAVYGANASGKSNLIYAINAVRYFVSLSATNMTIGDEIGVESFLLDREYMDQPSEFHFSLLLDGKRFDYGFSATSERVVGEWIFTYPRKKAKPWLERYYNEETNEYEWKFGGPLEKEKKGLIARTRDNGLALSRGVERNIKALEPLFMWFRNNLRVLDLSKSPETGMPRSLTLFKEDESFRSFMGSFIKNADMGISKITAVEDPEPEYNITQDIPEQLKKEIQSRLKKSSLMTWILTHKNQETDFSVDMLLDRESAGTQRLLALGGPLWDTLSHGYTLFVDELDCSLHPHLVRKLIELFQSSTHNKSGAQLIFVTHDSTLMDLTLFRRDQICIIEKQSSGASQMYSLWDFDTKPRKSEAIQRGYLSGRYGGIPNFGPELEFVE